MPKGKTRNLWPGRKSPSRKAARGKKIPPGSILRYVHSLSGKDGKILTRRVAENFGMSEKQVGETIGVEIRGTSANAEAQRKIQDMLEIVARVSDWAGGENQAMAWYRAEPIPAFAGRTAESLVKQGKAASVRDYLDSLALGGFA